MATKPPKMDVLSVRVPAELKEMIEYIADQDCVTVDAAVSKMLEEITQIERVRRATAEEAKLGWKSFGSGKAARRAERELAALLEARMATWRQHREDKVKLKRARRGERRIELASTTVTDRLAPQIDIILRAIAEICDEPDFASALVTDESYVSDFPLEPEDYPRLSAKLGIEIDPTSHDDRYICHIAAKLKSRGET